MMSLIDEYARNKEVKAENRIVRNQLKSGMEAEVIAKSAEIPLSRVKEIENQIKLEKV